MGVKLLGEMNEKSIEDVAAPRSSGEQLIHSHLIT
jgi:hypothetical protein